MERNKQSFTLILSSLLIMSFLPPKACVFGQSGAEPEEELNPNIKDAPIKLAELGRNYIF